MQTIKICLIFFISLVIVVTARAQEKITLSGKVTDAESKEALLGATVFVEGISDGTATNVEGFYSLSLVKGKHKIIFSFVGYKQVKKNINLTKNTTISIQLSPSSEKLDGVTISAEAPDDNIKSTEISIEKMDIEQIEKIPVIMGETDIMKTIQLLPGITSIAEGRSGYIVRGSSIDQNLILMDGIPLYYSSHMQGLYSVFNSDVVDHLTVYKGGIPAHFGGRGASVLDVKMKESDFDQYHATLSVGLITSKLSLEAPIVKDKLSVILAGRSTQFSIGNLIDNIKDNGNEETSKGGKGSSGKGGSSDEFRFFDPYESWWDINAKLVYKINDKHNLYLSGFYSKDNALTVGGITDWGVQAGSIRWKYQINEKLLSNTSFIYSKYHTHAENGLYIFNSGLKTISIKQEFSYFLNENNELRFGFSTEYQKFDHGSLEDTSQDDAGKFMPAMQSLESAFYIENKQKINGRLSAYYGLRFSLFHQLGPGDSFVYDEETNEPVSSTNYPGRTDVITSYYNLEPRFSLTFLINEKSSIKASYNRNAQYMRLMSLGMELQWYDIWMPCTKNIKPMLTDQVALGYFRNFLDNKLRFSVETYYKWMTNIADFEDGLHNYLIDNLEAYVALGQGRSYGLELSLEKPKGRFTGRINYNLSKSEYQIDVINQGRWYPGRFDKTHDLALILSYEVIKNLTISSTFLYSTGRPVTLPESYYYINNVPFPYWEGRNKYRLPDYHRMDLGIIYEPDFLSINLKKSDRKIRTSLEVSLYNIFNRRNVHTINYSSNSGGKQGSGDASHVFEPYGVSTYGFMPSFQIHIKF